MARWKPTTLQKWFKEQRDVKLSFADAWRFFLVRVADRAYDLVDENGLPLNLSDPAPYFYNLLMIAKDDDIDVDPRRLMRVASLLDHRGWGVRGKIGIEVALTETGREKAQQIID